MRRGQVSVRVALDVPTEAIGIERHYLDMGMNTPCWQGLRQQTTGMAHAADSQYPALSSDVLCVDSDPVGCQQLRRCLKDAFRLAGRP